MKIKGFVSRIECNPNIIAMYPRVDNTMVYGIFEAETIILRIKGAKVSDYSFPTKEVEINIKEIGNERD